MRCLDFILGVEFNGCDGVSSHRHNLFPIPTTCWPINHAVYVLYYYNFALNYMIIIQLHNTNILFIQEVVLTEIELVFIRCFANHS